MKLIIAGSRLLTDRRFVFDQIEKGVAFFNAYEALRVTQVVAGGARGVDALAAEWAMLRGIPCAVIPARWDIYGRHAGPRRNTEMLNVVRPDGALLVIRLATSTGSADMLKQVKNAGLHYVDITVEDELSPRHVFTEVHLHEV